MFLSPNCFMKAHTYKLRLPTCLDLADLVLKHGQGTLLYKVDLSRAYRQLPADPHDWSANLCLKVSHPGLTIHESAIISP